MGAKTVNGPLPLSVSMSPASVSAVASVLNEPAATAVSTMSFWAAGAAGAAAGAAMSAFFACAKETNDASTAPVSSSFFMVNLG